SSGPWLKLSSKPKPTASPPSSGDAPRNGPRARRRPGYDRLGGTAICDAITSPERRPSARAIPVMLRLAAALLLLVWCLPALAEQSHSRHAADQFGYVEAASLSRHAFNASQPACDEDVPGAAACAGPKDWQDVAWLKARAAWNFLFGTAERAIAV